MSNGYVGLPLQRKVAMTLLLTTAAFAAISYVILSEVIEPAFEALELEAARTDLIRAERAIDTDLENLAAVTADWAPWDDIYEYVNGRNTGFEKSNLNRPTLDNLNLDMMAVYAIDSELVWNQMLIEGKEHDPGVLDIFGPDDAAFMLLTQHGQASDMTVGIVTTTLGPMLISSQPILRSDDSGPIAGAVVMAQFMNESRLARLRERTEVNFRWTPVDQYAEESNVNIAQIDDGDMHIEAKPDAISSHTILADIFGAPVLVLGAETPRKISLLGGQTVKAAMMVMLLAGVLVTVVMWFLLRRMILKPIELLAGHMGEIRRSGDLSHKIDLDVDDEVGALATQFNRMTSDVHEARKALLFQSFKAGKADTAAEVLHNIRNAMTPLINGVERLGKTFRVADDLRVTDAAEQLRDGECPPERAAKLLEYVEASFEHIKTANADAKDDMVMVMSQARQVEDILADQERFADASPATENIRVTEVVGEAAHVIPKEARTEIDVELDGGLNRFDVHAHRIGLLQVLGNLILNAYESIQRTSRENGHILLSANNETVEDQEMVRLTVRDNGTGFDGDMSNRVFQRGFTSKGEGDSTGLGLHWCANAVAGMGGRISAESDGAGKGAEFHVLLPVAQGG